MLLFIVVNTKQLLHLVTLHANPYTRWISVHLKGAKRIPTCGFGGGEQDKLSQHCCYNKQKFGIWVYSTCWVHLCRDECTCPCLDPQHWRSHLHPSSCWEHMLQWSQGPDETHPPELPQRVPTLAGLTVLHTEESHTHPAKYMFI